MNVIAYTRVSTDTQVIDGYGLDVQRDAIQAWADLNGHTIVAWCCDEGITGKDGLDDRPGLADACRALEEGQAEALVVHKYDRLARKLFLQLTLINRLAEHDINVVSVAEPDVDGPDELRDLIRNILGAFAEYERAVIRSRLRAGAERKAAAGSRYAFGGRPPYGWRAEHKELVPLEEEQRVLRWIRELREDGLSNEQIAQQLNHEKLWRRDGKRWHREQVRRALAQPLPEVSNA